MVFSTDDRILVKSVEAGKEETVLKLISEFPNKSWTLLDSKKDVVDVCTLKVTCYDVGNVANSRQFHVFG